MDFQKGQKLNRLILDWPRNGIYTTSFLEKSGYSRALIHKYVQSRWIRPIGRGAYILYNDHVTWDNALSAVQNQLDREIYIGGKSALRIFGYSFYLSEEKHLFLYGDSQNLPKWFTDRKWDLEIECISAKLFSGNLTNSYTKIDCAHPIITSSVERALLEMLYHIPAKTSFKEAISVIEQLTSLNSGIIQELLEKCNRIKIKRLFLFFSEKCNHKWVHELDLSKINIGKGKMQIYKGGIFDKKYKITVPQIDRGRQIYI